jgi:hypothetical protein
LVGALAGIVWWGAAAASEAQYQQRYQPNRPTVSPYLDLFRFNDSNVPNYYTLVRPMQQQRVFEQQQQRLNQQQLRELSQLQSNVQALELGPVTAPQVAPTGKGSWFARPGGAAYLDTSDYFSRVGSGSRTRVGSGTRTRVGSGTQSYSGSGAQHSRSR